MLRGHLGPPLRAVGPGDRVHGPVRRVPGDGPDMVCGEVAHPAGGELRVQPRGAPGEGAPGVVQGLGAGGAQPGGRLPVELSAGPGGRVDERHPQPEAGGGDGGGEPGRPRADDGEVVGVRRRDRHARVPPGW